MNLRLLVALLSVLTIVAPATAQPSPPKKVIFDQDTDGIISGNDTPLLMLLQSPNIDVLGVTVVTGNGWLKQETADILKLLEILERPDVPVYMGSEFPLVQPRELPVQLTKMYGQAAVPTRFWEHTPKTVRRPIKSIRRRVVLPVRRRKKAMPRFLSSR